MKTVLFSFIVLAFVCPLDVGAGTDNGSFKAGSCWARWDQSELAVGNGRFEHRWQTANGVLRSLSIKNLKSGMEWVQASDRVELAPGTTISRQSLRVEARMGRLTSVEEESLLIEIGGGEDSSVLYQVQIFPGASGAVVRSLRSRETGATTFMPIASNGSEATGVEVDPNSKASAPKVALLDSFSISPRHLRLTDVTLKDQTDVHNELAFEREWLLAPNEATLDLSGNLFWFENPQTASGLVFLKLGPLPHARPLKSAWDIQVEPGKRTLQVYEDGYPVAWVLYSGGREGRIEALHGLQRQLRRYEPARDGQFLSNTWGDRSRDARINEEFMMKEIAAGARLGVDVVQIDDGWQKGRTANSSLGKGAWNGFWAADPEFWQPHPQRFPNGLGPLLASARERGMKFGLWFGPDTSEEGIHWKRDADRILELHRSEAVDYIKLDSVKAVSPSTERNFRSFIHHVLDESKGRVVFDLDVTAEVRPGYFGAVEAGPVFVENRYTDWVRYWPHFTLRNLWKLSHYVDPLRLRMEVLNNTRNPDKYPDDPLAPAHYSPDTLFATVMFSNPLGWFETSMLPEDYVAKMSALVSVWKREREALFSGTILPIGDVPDGVNWTGFVSIANDGSSCHALIFRELNQQASWSLPLKPGATWSRVTPLSGSGSAAIDGGVLRVTIPETLQYLWVRLD